MKTLDTCLTLIVPTALAESVTDLLLEHPEWVNGFATHPVAAHGPVIALSGSGEEVRGHSPRVEIRLVTARAEAAALLDTLRVQLPNPDIFHWTTPVLEFGRLS